MAKIPITLGSRVARIFFHYLTEGSCTAGEALARTRRFLWLRFRNPGGLLYSYINQYDAGGKFIRTFAGKGREQGLVDCPHGLIVDSRSGTPTLLVADRSNRRLQRFSLEGESLSIDPGFAHPCHFSEHKGLMVVPDLFAKVVVIDGQNAVVAELGDNGPDSWKALRTGPREGFPSGRFVCPHGAAFDRHGNIFVVEWVEIGRVTKLRKV